MKKTDEEIILGMERELFSLMHNAYKAGENSKKVKLRLITFVRMKIITKPEVSNLTQKAFENVVKKLEEKVKERREQNAAAKVPGHSSVQHGTCDERCDEGGVSSG